MTMTEHTPAHDVPAPTGRGTRAKWAVGSALIVLGISVLGLWGLRSPDAVSYFVTASEITAQGAEAQGKTYRLGGRVVAGTLERRGPAVSFAVTDGNAEVAVSYVGEVPDTLKEGTDVVAEGMLGPDGALVASRVMAKCSSRFVPAVEQDARERAEATGAGSRAAR